MRDSIGEGRNATYIARKENFTDLKIFRPYVLVPTVKLSWRQLEVL
jgi:hypothetical protein